MPAGGGLTTALSTKDPAAGLRTKCLKTAAGSKSCSCCGGHQSSDVFFHCLEN